MKLTHREHMDLNFTMAQTLIDLLHGLPDPSIIWLLHFLRWVFMLSEIWPYTEIVSVRICVYEPDQ